MSAPPVKKRRKAVRQLSSCDDLAELFGEHAAGGDAPPSAESQEEPFESMLENALSELDDAAVINQISSEHAHDEPDAHTRRHLLRMQPQAELDLHGCHVREALVRVESFIETAERQGLHTVRIVVGKGLHSPGGAVLPDAVEKKIVELRRRGRIATFAWEKKYKRTSGSIIAVLP